MTKKTKAIQKQKGRKPKYNVGVKQSQNAAQYKKELRHIKNEAKKRKASPINDKAVQPESDFTLRFV